MTRVPLTSPSPVDMVERPLDTVPSRELGRRHGAPKGQSPMWCLSEIVMRGDMNAILRTMARESLAVSSGFH